MSFRLTATRSAIWLDGSRFVATDDKMDNTIKLRNLSKADSKRLAELANNKNIYDNLRDTFPYPYGEKDAVSFIEMILNDKQQHVFGITYNDQLAGIIGLIGKPDVYRKGAEIGYWLGEPYWNKGIASKAVKLMVDYGFSELDLVRIDTGVFEFNKASCRVLEKCGFTFEGIFRKSVWKNNRFVNERRYAIIKD